MFVGFVRVLCDDVTSRSRSHTPTFSHERQQQQLLLGDGPLLFCFTFSSYDGKKKKQGGRETHYKKRNGTHTHTHVIPRRNGGCYIMCVCDRVANNERCEKKERTERKGSSLLILIRNDKGKKPKKNQKKNKKGIPFHSRYGVG